MIEWIKFAATVVAMIFSAGTFVYVQLDKRQRATIASMNELKNSVDERFERKSQRISSIEAELNLIPKRAELELIQSRSREDLLRLHERIDEINAGIKQSQFMIGKLIGLTKDKKNSDD